MGEDRYIACCYIEPTIAIYECVYGQYPNIEQYKELKRKYKNLTNALYYEEMENARQMNKDVKAILF